MNKAIQKDEQNPENIYYHLKREVDFDTQRTRMKEFI